MGELMVFLMKCSKCNTEYDIQDFISFRKYDNEGFLLNNLDLCNNCKNKSIQQDKFDELKDKLADKGYKLYEISRCSCYDDCKKIDNIRRMCEKKEEVDKSPDFGSFPLSINWCNPAEGGIIRASVKLYELFDNYDKSSTELSKNMLKYTKNMHKLTWFILGFTIISSILTIVNVYIAIYM